MRRSRPEAFPFDAVASAYARRCETLRGAGVRLAGPLPGLLDSVAEARAAWHAWTAIHEIQDDWAIVELAWAEAAHVRPQRLLRPRDTRAVAAAESFDRASQVAPLFSPREEPAERRWDLADECPNAELTVAEAHPLAAACLLWVGGLVVGEEPELPWPQLLEWADSAESGGTPGVRGAADRAGNRLFARILELEQPAAVRVADVRAWLAGADLKSRQARDLLVDGFRSSSLPDGDEAHDVFIEGLLARIEAGDLPMSAADVRDLLFDEDNEILWSLQYRARQATPAADEAFLNWALTEDAVLGLLRGRGDSEDWWRDLDVDRVSLLKRAGGDILDKDPMLAFKLAMDGELDIEPEQFCKDLVQALVDELDRNHQDSLDYVEAVEVTGGIMQLLSPRTRGQVYKLVQTSGGTQDRVLNFDEIDGGEEDDEENDVSEEA